MKAVALAVVLALGKDVAYIAAVFVVTFAVVVYSVSGWWSVCFQLSLGAILLVSEPGQCGGVWGDTVLQGECLEGTNLLQCFAG